jgi:predicted nuclease with TOPRIM domain
MNYIAKEMREVSQEMGGEVTSNDILEVYHLEQHLLAEEVGIPGETLLLDKYLDLIEHLLGDESVTAGSRSEVVSLLKVIHYLMNHKNPLHP